MKIQRFSSSELPPFEEVLSEVRKYAIPLYHGDPYEFKNSILNDSSVESVDVKSNEGDGGSLHMVLYFSDYDKYVKISGHYYSYHGIDIDDVKEVRPIQKTITFYE